MGSSDVLESAAMTTVVERRPFTTDEYHRMADAGILGEDDRVELLAGEVVRMRPIGGRHAACVNRLTRLFGERVAAQEAIVSVQNPIRLDPHSEPQPDLALLRWRADYYASGLPGSSAVLVVVAVADSLLDLDRTVKLPLYAAAGIAEVWLVDLGGETVEVHRRPGAGGRADGYGEVRRYGRGAHVTAERPALALPHRDGWIGTGPSGGVGAVVGAGAGRRDAGRSIPVNETRGEERGWVPLGDYEDGGDEQSEHPVNKKWCRRPRPFC